jgi:acid phosphatase (class A)
MKIRLLLLFCCALLPCSIFAQDGKGNDESNYYLDSTQVANSIELLPTPPEVGSILFLYDEARYQWGKLQRDTPRGEQAVQDARVDGDGVPMAFSKAFGIDITQETTPEIYRLLIHMREDAGDLATRSAKKHYNRKRPFAFYNEDTGNPELRF